MKKKFILSVLRYLFFSFVALPLTAAFSAHSDDMELDIDAYQMPERQFMEIQPQWIAASPECVASYRHERNDHKLPRDAQIQKLDALLKSQLHLNDEQVSRFIDQLLRSASELTPTLPTSICINEEEKIVLPAKILILARNIINYERHINGTWNWRLMQEEERIIEAHLAQNPDSDVRANEYGVYSTWDDKKPCLE